MGCQRELVRPAMNPCLGHIAEGIASGEIEVPK
jgi:hypothetical protein